MGWLNTSGMNYLIGQLRSKLKITETRYSYTTTSSQTVTFTVPGFSSSTMTLDVYVNGLHCIPGTDYTLSGNVVTMANELDVGQTCSFVVRKVGF
jgi:hypothetical protein